LIWTQILKEFGLVHGLPAYLVACRHVLLSVLTCATSHVQGIGVLHVASLTVVPVGHIPTTGETHVPVVEMLGGVGENWIVLHLLMRSHYGGGGIPNPGAAGGKAGATGRGTPIAGGGVYCPRVLLQ
jgi:hypothetical protein